MLSNSARFLARTLYIRARYEVWWSSKLASYTYPPLRVDHKESLRIDDQAASGTICGRGLRRRTEITA